MDICNPSCSDIVVQAVLRLAGSCRNNSFIPVLQCKAHTCNAFAPRRWVKSLYRPCLRAGLRIPHLLVLSMALFRLSSQYLGWNLASIREWFGLRVAASNVQFWECTIFLWMTQPIYSIRAQLPLWLGESVQLPFTALQDLMCCRDVYEVAL
jgi:hypothetical protein